jgi:hypothetical protein
MGKLLSRRGLALTDSFMAPGAPGSRPTTPAIFGGTVMTHPTAIEGLWPSILAGIDLIQHPEILTPREVTDGSVRLIRERNVICPMLSNMMTGEAWRKHLKTKEETQI